MFTRRSHLLYLAVLLWLSACQAMRQSAAPSAAGTDLPGNPVTALPTALPGAAPLPSPTSSLRQLTLCLGEEPSSLFWYEAVSPAARRVLSALYDGPFDRLNFNNRAVILEKEPALQDGDVLREPVPAMPGEWIYDAAGERVVLREGVRYRPAGCLDSTCVAVYSGNDAVSLDQVVIRFRLRSGLVWSDGAPLTADDSLFSYEIARALQPSGWSPVLQATRAYQAIGDLTLEWQGAPGYSGGSYAEKFFMPLPRHAWSGLDPQDLPTAEISARSPLGWGAFQMESWQAGQQIVLRKNLNYFRAEEGLPYFDRLVYRFLSPNQPALQALASGECDWVDPNLIPPQGFAELLNVQAGGEAQLIMTPVEGWEQITMGIVRSDGAISMVAQREVRLALAQCIDRQKVARQALGELALVAQGFLPPGHPLSDPSAQGIPFDPQAGEQLLAAAGWVDLDGDPETMRTAQGVPGVADGTPLVLTYLVSPEADRQLAARQVQADLAACGVSLAIVIQPFGDYLAPGPQGPVFGRQFQLAQFAWSSAEERLCALYLSSEIPGPLPQHPKGWGGGNASGYSNPVYDQACQMALVSLPDSPQKTQALQEAQRLFQQDLPALPLYWRINLAAARADLCMPGSPDPSADLLWNIESFYRAQTCPSE